MSSNSSCKKILIGLGIGIGLGLALSPATREKIKMMFSEKSEDILPDAKEKIGRYLSRFSEAVTLGKAAFQQREDELEQLMRDRAHRKEAE